MDACSIGSNRNNVVARQRKTRKLLMQQGPDPVIQRVTIGSLPDNVLVEIFDFCQVVINKFYPESPWNWEKLVHVCRRWRYLVFESPLRLNLQLFCTENSPVRKLLDVWPAFPLVILFRAYNVYPWSEPGDSFDSDDLIAALGHRDRVRQIDIHSPPEFLWEQIVMAMQEPFPALKSLSFSSSSWTTQVLPQIPDTFLNGSVPCLRDVSLSSISFPSLPRLLLSTSNLASLHLFGIPESGYITPETMATSLSALPKLKSLMINFESPTPHPQRRNRPVPPPTRFVLPALTRLEFQGVSEYLEVLVAQIDAPLLDDFYISFFQQLVFDIPQIIRFFGHLDTFRSSSLSFHFDSGFNAYIDFPSNTPRHSAGLRSWRIMCNRLDQQVISVAQICNEILPFYSGIDSLSITCRGLDRYTDPFQYDWPDEIDFALWSELFHPFISVHSLDIPSTLVEPFVATASQGLTGESVPEVFPSLRNLFIIGDISDEDAQRHMEYFVAARQENGRPITVSHREA